MYLPTSLLYGLLLVAGDPKLVCELENANGRRRFRHQEENRVEFLVGPIIPRNFLVESILRSNRKRMRSGDVRGGPVFGRSGTSLNRACKVSARYAKDYRDLLVSVSEIFLCQSRKPPGFLPSNVLSH